MQVRSGDLSFDQAQAPGLIAFVGSERVSIIAVSRVCGGHSIEKLPEQTCLHSFSFTFARISVRHGIMLHYSQCALVSGLERYETDARPLTETYQLQSTSTMILNKLKSG